MAKKHSFLAKKAKWPKWITFSQGEGGKVKNWHHCFVFLQVVTLYPIFVLERDGGGRAKGLASTLPRGHDLDLVPFFFDPKNISFWTNCALKLDLGVHFFFFVGGHILSHFRVKLLGGFFPAREIS